MAMVTVRLGDGRLYDIPEEYLDTIGMDQTMNMNRMDTNSFGLDSGNVVDEQKASIYSLADNEQSISPSLANFQELTQQQVNMLEGDRQYRQRMDGTMAEEAPSIFTGGADSQVGVESQAGTATSRGQGLLDRLLGSELPETYGLLDEKQMQEAQSRARDEGLLNASVALLRAGAPQTTRVGIGEAIASAMQAGRQATGNIYDQRLEQAVFMNELTEKREAKEKAENRNMAINTLANYKRAYNPLDSNQNPFEQKRKLSAIGVALGLGASDINDIIGDIGSIAESQSLADLRKTLNELKPQDYSKDQNNLLGLTGFSDNVMKALEANPEATKRVNRLLALHPTALDTDQLNKLNIDIGRLSYDTNQNLGMAGRTKDDIVEELIQVAGQLKTGTYPKSIDEENSQETPTRSSNQDAQADDDASIDTKNLINSVILDQFPTEKDRNAFKAQVIKEHPQRKRLTVANYESSSNLEVAILDLLEDKEAIKLLTVNIGNDKGTLTTFLEMKAIDSQRRPDSGFFDAIAPERRAAFAKLSTILSRVGLAEITRMKSQTQTGATGFGALNQPELELLVNSLGSFKDIRTEKDLEQRLQSMVNIVKRKKEQAQIEYSEIYNPDFATRKGNSFNDQLKIIDDAQGSFRTYRKEENQNGVSQANETPASVADIMGTDVETMSEKETKRNLAILEGEVNKVKSTSKYSSFINDATEKLGLKDSSGRLLFGLTDDALGAKLEEFLGQSGSQAEATSKFMEYLKNIQSTFIKNLPESI